MEHGKFEAVVIVRDTDQGRYSIHQRDQLIDKYDCNDTGHHVEDEMRRSEAFARLISAHGPKNSGDGGTDIGANRERQCILIGDLTGRERRDGQHQGGVAGLHHHGGEYANKREQQHARVPGNRIFGQVDRILEGIEAILHVVDAKEQEAEPGQDIAGTLERPGRLKDQDYAERQHRHCIGRNIDLETEAGDQPGARRGTQVGAKNDADTGGQGDQPRAEKGDRDHRHQRTGLHQRGADNAEQHTLGSR